MFESYKAIFSARGAAYHHAMQAYPDARAEEFRAILSHLELKAGMTVADMPSGGGYCGRYLPDGVELIAIDESEAFLKQGEGARHGRAVCAPLQATGLDAGSCDAVLSLAGLHHVHDKAGFFQEAHRMLVSGGDFVVADAFEGSAVARFLDGFVNDNNSMGHRGEYLNDELVSAVERCGFDIVSARLIEYPWIFKSIETMGEYCRLLFGMDRASSTEAVAEGIARSLKVVNTARGIEMGWGLFFIHAKKRVE